MILCIPVAGGGSVSASQGLSALNAMLRMCLGLQTLEKWATVYGVAKSWARLSNKATGLEGWPGGRPAACPCDPGSS